jgi:hypothetical protein
MYKWVVHDSVIIKESVQLRSSHHLLALDHPPQKELEEDVLN